MSSTRIRGLSLLALSLSMLLLPERASAQFMCAGCFIARVVRLTEYANEGETLVVAKWVQAIPRTETDPGATEFEIVTVVRQPNHQEDKSSLDERTLQSVDALHRGDHVGMRFYQTGKSGDLFLISGSMNEDRFEWDSPRAVTAAALRYCLEAPGTHASPVDRIRYSARFIDSNDEAIASDALDELENASFEDLEAVGSEFPRLKLRKLLSATPTCERQNLCFRLLGVYGNEKDATLLEPYVFTKQDKTSPDQLEILIAYLLLKGERGLAVLNNKLQDDEADFRDRENAMSAICYVARNSKRAPRDSMIQSLRMTLNDTDFAEAAILALMNLKDWDIQDQLFEIFLREEVEFTTLRLAVTRFFMAAVADMGDCANPQQVPPRALQARQFLDTIKQQHPELIEQANEYAQVNLLAP